MFNSITGTLTALDAVSICIDTHGIEWQVFVPRPNAFGAIGEQTRVFTWLLHTDTAMTLFGFAAEDERTLFTDLLKVDGIGARAAVKILSHIDRKQLIAALDSGDTAAIEKVPGVGRKTAAKMMLALKGRLTLPADIAPKVAVQVPFQAVVDSLVSMGYDRRDCESVIARLSGAAAQDTSWQDKRPTEKEDTVFRRALVELAGKK